uniref:YES proto-oncogene 1, Src family tyrosine kinase n=1 Tax=Cynoglossus semilaevis TaxID=244447 RepID=A0A3P8W558_CYNSE
VSCLKSTNVLVLFGIYLQSSVFCKLLNLSYLQIRLGITALWEDTKDLNKISFSSDKIGLKTAVAVGEDAIKLYYYPQGRNQSHGTEQCDYCCREILSEYTNKKKVHKLLTIR